MTPDTVSSSKRRGLTKFLCQELLFEFVSGSLDTDKQREVDEYLSTCRESQQELERLKRGLVFTNQLAKVPISEEMKSALMGFEPQWQRRLRQWTVWWSNRGWRILPYAVVAAVTVLGLAVFKPWKIVVQRDVVLVEEKRRAESATATLPIGEAKTVAETEAETAGKSVADAKVVAPSPVAPAQVETAKTETAAGEEAAAPPKKSIVFRANYTVPDLAVAQSAIREKITEFGGSVIGKGELGEIRGDGNAFFHFSLPESKREEFETFLKTFGPVRFKQQADPRVMPDGEIHIILTVKDGGPKHDESETPETP